MVMCSRCKAEIIDSTNDIDHRIARVVIAAVAAAFEYSKEDILQKNGPRPKKLVYARLIATYLVRKYTKLTVYYIGDMFDKLHHARVSKRNGEWEEILAMPPEDMDIEQHRAVAHYKIVEASVNAFCKEVMFVYV